MEFRQIRYFLEIHRRGSFVKAAAALGLTQPALSRQIALLERETGHVLLERGGRSLRLTPAGEKFLERAVKLDDLWKETLGSLDEDSEALAGRYSISAGQTAAAYVLPHVLNHIRREHTGVSFRVIEGDAHETREALLGGDVDLGILTGAQNESELTRKFFLTDTIIPVVAAQHPLARRKRIGVEALRDSEFVFYHPASAIRQVMEKKFRSLRPTFRPEIAMEMRNVESVVRSIEAGLGVGFISRFALTDRLRELAIPELSAERRFYFCYRRGRPGLTRLIEAIEAAHEAAEPET